MTFGAKRNASNNVVQKKTSDSDHVLLAALLQQSLRLIGLIKFVETLPPGKNRHHISGCHVWTPGISLILRYKVCDCAMIVSMVATVFRGAFHSLPRVATILRTLGTFIRLWRFLFFSSQRLSFPSQRLMMMRMCRGPGVASISAYLPSGPSFSITIRGSQHP